MVTIKVHTPIASQQEGMFFSMDGAEESVFSLEACRNLFDAHPRERDFRFELHCPGGSVPEGLAIYDFLRTSGKNIYMNIEGACHSMAVVLLLAAPRENRTANPNCRALIHKVSGSAYGGTADELEQAARSIRQYQESILDIYADRTGEPRERLAQIMDEERERTAQELLEWGFIGRINTYNTNFKPNNIIMNIKQLKQKANDFLNSLREVLSVVNYDFVDEDGSVLFSTEGEDDTLETGMPATPDGTFTIADGRQVTIADGVITEIVEPDAGEDTELEAENRQLRGQLVEAAAIIRDLKKNLRSNYTPAGRLGTPSKGARTANSGPARKDDVRERLSKTKSNQ